MISFVRAAFLAVALIYIGTIYANSAIILLGFVLCVWMLVSLAYLICCSRRVELDLRIPMHMADENSKVDMVLETRDLLAWAPKKVKGKISVRNYIGDYHQKKWLDSNNPYQLYVGEPGNYEVNLKWVKIYDFTGMFYVRRRGRMVRNIQVMPDSYQMNVRVTDGTRNFFGDADMYDDFRPGYDPTELYDVRKFQDGDRIQSIHWKLSARSDQLMVKENSMPKACAVTLLANPAKHANKKLEKGNSANFMRLLAGISFSLMDQGCPHYVAWYSKSREEIVRARIDDEESYYQFLVYFSSESLEMHTDARTLYEDRYRGELLLYLVEITGKLEIIRGHEKIGRPKGENIKREMEAIELVL